MEAFTCAACTATIATEADPARCPHCGASPWLDGRYRLLEVVGRGGTSLTWRATRLDDPTPLCIKELPLRMAEPDAVRLMRREAAVLRQLEHPGIPRYRDDFLAGTGRAAALYLVQDFVDGVSLEAARRDRRFTEDQVLEMLAEVARILAWLHGLAPPVVHRDLKPANLMLGPDGRLFLVDFGAVKDLIGPPEGGPTLVGTYGYMAPEQFAGQASPASDCYALGAVAVALLSQRAPSDLIDGTHVLRWEQAVQVRPATRALLRRLLATEPAERPADGAAASREIEAARKAPASVPSPSPPTVAPASKVEAPRIGSRGLWWGLGLLLAGGLIAAWLRDNSPSRAPGHTERPPHPPIAGVSLGQTEFDLRATFPALKPVTERRTTTYVDLEDVHVEQIEIPGPAFEAEVPLGGETARCRFELAIADRLSSMRCTWPPQPSLERQRRLTDTLVADIARSSGGPGLTPPGSSLGGTLSQATSWFHAEADLTVRSEYREPMFGGAPGSELEMDWRSSAHEALEARLEDEARTRHTAEKQRQAAERERVYDRAKAGGQ